MPPSTAPAWRSRLLPLVGIIALASTLRNAVGALSPIGDEVASDLHLGALELGLLGAAPPIVFAVSGLLAPRLARRLGLEHTATVAMLVAALGHLLRGVAPEPITLGVGTVLALAGAGVGNVLLPPLLRRWFPDRIAALSAVYLTIMSVGASMPSVVAVPVSEEFGWRVALGSWAALSLLAAIPWITHSLLQGSAARRVAAAQLAEPEPRTGEIVLAPEDEGGPLLASTGRVRILRSPTAWALSLSFGATALSAYATFAWLPQMLRDLAGLDDAGAGLLLGVFAILGFPEGVLVPLLLARLRSPAPLIGVAIVCFLGGWSGMLLAPMAAPVLWVALIGLGPLLFPLNLTLVALRTRTHDGAVALSAFVQGLGYGIGACGPLLVGLLYEMSDDWTAPLILLLAATALTLPSLVVLRRARVVEDEPGVVAH